MTAPVLTPQGFIAPTTAQEVADLNAKFLANVNASLNLDPNMPWGQIIGIFAQKLSEKYQLDATLYNSLNPAAAEGNLLANVCTLSGTIPQVATYSTVTCNLQLAASTTVTAGSVVAVAGQPQNTWVLTSNVTSTSAGSYPGVFRSSLPGPYTANAATITVINTPVGGWTTVSNPNAATAGVAADTDTTLRQRRLSEINGQGSGDTNAIRAAILKIGSPIIQAFVFENTSLVTDSTGLPGKAFRAVVWAGVGGLATVLPSGLTVGQTIANTIWANKPTGIQSFGAQVYTVTDSAGNPQQVYFDQANQLGLYVTCTVTPAPASSSLTDPIRVAVKGAIQAWVQTNLLLGVGVIARAFSASPLEIQTSPTGTVYTPVVTDVPTFAFDIIPSPTNTANLPGSYLNIYTLASTSTILVNGF